MQQFLVRLWKFLSEIGYLHHCCKWPLFNSTPYVQLLHASNYLRNLQPYMVYYLINIMSPPGHLYHVLQRGANVCNELSTHYCHKLFCEHLTINCIEMTGADPGGPPEYPTRPLFWKGNFFKNYHLSSLSVPDNWSRRNTITQHNMQAYVLVNNVLQSNVSLHWLIFFRYWTDYTTQKLDINSAVFSAVSVPTIRHSEINSKDMKICRNCISATVDFKKCGGTAPDSH